MVPIGHQRRSLARTSVNTTTGNLTTQVRGSTQVSRASELHNIGISFLRVTLDGVQNSQDNLSFVLHKTNWNSHTILTYIVADLSQPRRVIAALGVSTAIRFTPRRKTRKAMLHLRVD